MKDTACGGLFAMVMVAIVWLGPTPPPLMKTPPVISDEDIPKFSRKPCPSCDASSISYSRGRHRCQVCGEEFERGD